MARFRPIAICAVTAVVCFTAARCESQRAPLTSVRVGPAGAQTFPQGTALVLEDTRHGRCYFSTNSFVGMMPGKARFALPDGDGRPDFLQLSADATMVLLRGAGGSDVLRASDLHRIRHLDNRYAFWNGNRISYLDLETDAVVSGHERFRIMRAGVHLLGCDIRGRYFLAVRQLNRGTIANGYNPMNLLMLAGWSHNHRLVILRNLTKAEYDPGSAGDPRRLAVLDPSVVVYGYPRGAAIDEDFVGIAARFDRRAPLSGRHGYPMQCVGSPVNAGSEIVGLADIITWTSQPGAAGRYLYRVSRTRMSVRRVPDHTVLVTYDPAHRTIYTGTRTGKSVTLHPLARP